MQNKIELIHTLCKIGAIQLGNFQLKSGAHSPIYLNLRKTISYPDLLRTLSTLAKEKTSSLDFDLVCGVPYTALPIATCFSLDYNIPMIIRRKEKKSYGTQQMIEGEFTSGQSCLIIEDVITTGSSIIETAASLTEVGLIIKDVVVFIDRQEKKLANALHIHSLFSLTDILNTLLASCLLNNQERSLIELFLESRA